MSQDVPRCPKESMKNLHRIASPREYRKYFDRIFEFAERHLIRRSLSGEPGARFNLKSACFQVCLRTHLELTDSSCVSAWAVEFVHFFAWVLMFLARVRRFCVRGFPKVILLARHIVNMLSDGLAQRKFVWPCSWSTAKTSAIKLAVFQFCMLCALVLGCVYCKVVLCYRNSLVVNRTHFIFVECAQPCCLRHGVQILLDLHGLPGLAR